MWPTAPEQSPKDDGRPLLIASSPPISPDVTEAHILNSLGISIPTTSRASLLDDIPVLPAMDSFDGFESRIEWFTPPEPNPFDSPILPSDTSATLAGDASGTSHSETTSYVDNFKSPETRILPSTMQQEYSFEDFEGGVVQYILDSMEDSMTSSELIPTTHTYSNLQSSPLPSSSLSEGLDSGSSLLGPRHRKDPSYSELPSISIIEATPRGLCEFTFGFPQPPTTIPIQTEKQLPISTPSSQLCSQRTPSSKCLNGTPNRAEVGRPSPTEDLYMGPSEHANGPSMLSFLVNALGSRIRRASTSGGERPDPASQV